MRPPFPFRTVVRWTLLAVGVLSPAACSGAGFSGAVVSGDADAGSDDAGEPDATTDPGEGGTSAVKCKANRADCNKQAQDGCEVDTSSNPKNCGGCGRACAKGQVCANGDCMTTCPSGLTTCGASCVDITISPDNCGGCDKPCAAPNNATAECTASQCGFQCNADFEACGNACCPKQVTPPPPPVQPGAALAAGGNHSCAIMSGALKCWGSNGSGKLGDNSQSDRTKAVQVQGLTTGVVAVGCGDIHTCALLTGGEVRCWGGNTYGQLGNGATTTSQIPTSVNGLSSGVIALSVGKEYACAIVTGGAVKCWGANDRGQLGDGTNEDSNVPVDVKAMPHPAVSIAAGTSHACALLDDASIYCWGSNDRGELGDGTLTDQNAPVAVKSVPANVVVIAAGYSHSCARTTAGAVHCWGSNGSGQLGDGSGNDSDVPVQVSTIGDATAVDLGSFHSCAVVTGAGTVMCWGLNSSGQLGDGTSLERDAPVTISSVATTYVDVAAGSSHSCARTQGDAIKCWGSNTRGQLGNGTTTSSAVPVSVQGL